MTMLLLGIALLGFIVWAIIKYVPMPDIFKNVIVVSAAVYAAWKLILALGIPLP